jgi:hypothetical protein
LKCFCFPIFSACRLAALRSQFFNPALFRRRRNGQRRLIKIKE